ncbi:MAG: rRNA maturation RNase YbeY [Pseudomonadota bacterium]|nr:rRNA maturation RNase YbeY [Pseudomonadota bacterium]
MSQDDKKKNRSLHLDVNDLCDCKSIPSVTVIKKWLSYTLNYINHKSIQNHTDFEVSLRIVSETDMKELNDQYRRQNKVTNVLSFPSKMNDLLNWPQAYRYHLGDIVICASILDEESKKQKKNIQFYWCHIVIHGFLHLFGYDHSSELEAEEMENLEREICVNLGFMDPYIPIN